MALCQLHTVCKLHVRPSSFHRSHTAIDFREAKASEGLTESPNSDRQRLQAELDKLHNYFMFLEKCLVLVVKNSRPLSIHMKTMLWALRPIAGDSNR